MLPALPDSTMLSSALHDSLLHHAAARDSLTFWQILLDSSQWTLVNLIATIAALAGLIALAYGLWRWWKKRDTGSGGPTQIINAPVAGDVFGPGSRKEVHLNPTEQRREQLLAARRRYLERLQRHCQALPLAALGGEEGTEEELTLDRVYIELMTTTRIEKAGGKPEEPERRARPDAEAGDKSRPLTALEAAAQAAKLVILGDPGSGKSTFVKKLAAWLAAANLGASKAPEGIAADLLPILVVLRDLPPRLSGLALAALSQERQREQLAHAVRDQILADLNRFEARGFSEGMREILSEGRCLLILDGLDEVPFDQRRLVRRAVAAVLEHFRVARLIITCRIRSYAGEAVFPGFASHTLAPFDESQVQGFTAAWYKAQHEMGRVEADKVKDKASDLAAAALSPALRELAANPMMLTTMAIIHQREIGLPRERVRLYNLAVDVLLRRWQKRKLGAEALALTPALSAFLADDLRLRTVMERLAFEAHQSATHKGQAADLTRGAALTLLEQTPYLGTAALAAEFLDYVDQRSGLLVGRGGDLDKPASYSFPHRTFQEYLAGCHLISQRDPARTYFALAETGDYWAPAAQLGGEELLYNRRSQNTLLDLAYHLCPAGTPTSAQQYRAVLWSASLAGLLPRAAIEQDTGSPDGGRIYLERLRPNLVLSLRSSLSPVERADCGNMLHALGDPRLEVTTLEHMQFCFVPPGPFWMGSPDSDKEADNDEKPLHRNEQLRYGYWVSRFPITLAQYQLFVTASGHKPTDPDCLKDPANRPVRYVTWHEAVKFCKWLTAKWQQEGHLPADWAVQLPSEAEWEKAARGGLELPAEMKIHPIAEIKFDRTNSPKLQPNSLPQRRYPWGDEAQTNLANYGDAKIGTTSAVGCFPGGRSHYGCEEMSGNVWEWCRTKWRENYKQPADDSPEGSESRVLRGGAFDYNQRLVRCAYRYRSNPVNWSYYIGFRVVVSPLL